MIKIEQDGFYLNSIGEIVHIEARGDGLIYDENGNIYIYKENGRFGESNNNSDYDLIGYIPKELHYEILKMITDYHLSGSNKL